MAENAPPPQDMAKNQILNLQLYNPQKPKPDAPQIQPASFFPSYSTNPFIPPHMTNMYPNPMMMQQPTIVAPQIYDIKVGGPADTHEVLNMVYEDTLPTAHIKNSYVSLGDRLKQSDYIRSILFPGGDGTEAGFTKNSKNNLLEHIKFMDLNPYNTYRFSSNPYKGLPDGFLIYRSCYPIQRDPRNGLIICARNSMSVNVRVYKLTVGAFKINKQNKLKYSDFNQWREVAYYEYVKERILKNKTCPNFVGMLGYYTTEKSNIDFERVTKLSNFVMGQTPAPEPAMSKITGNPQAEWFLKNLEDQKKLGDAMAPFLGPTGVMNALKDRRFTQQPVAAEDENDYKGAVLTIMTESPTYNLYNWASKIYQVEGNVKKMVNTGFHSGDVWMSILFQLIVALYVMQINKININNFSIRNNVYIKDVSTEANVTRYWKYKINNLDFYVPNYGYLLLIDTNYSDLSDGQETTFIDNDKSKHKLDGVIYDSSLDIDKLNDSIFKNFINCVDTNNFKGDFIGEGGTPPPQEVLSVMDKMHSDAIKRDSKNIGLYLILFMRQYMNNRIGTYLKEQEYVNVRKDDMRNVKPGQVVVLDEGNGTFKFVLFKMVENGVAKILTKDESINPEEIIDKDVPITNLHNYSRHEPILQNYKLNEANLTEEAIIETYTILE
jgi:hypothetical protein